MQELAILVTFFTMAIITIIATRHLVKQIKKGENKKIFAEFLLCLILSSLSFILSSDSGWGTGIYLSCICFGGTAVLFFLLPIKK